MNVLSYIYFTPCSLPLELVKALPSQQRVLHRLVYRCSPVLEHDSMTFRNNKVHSDRGPID
jgi:hypothetical protein